MTTVYLGRAVGARTVKPAREEPGHYLWLGSFGWHDCTPEEDSLVQKAIGRPCPCIRCTQRSAYLCQPDWPSGPGLPSGVECACDCHRVPKGEKS